MLRGGHDLGEGRGEVLLGFGDGQADAGDDLDGRLEELVLGLRVLVLVAAQFGQQVAGGRGQLAADRIDQLQLPLDAQAGARRGVERDPHPRNSSG